MATGHPKEFFCIYIKKTQKTCYSFFCCFFFKSGIDMINIHNVSQSIATVLIRKHPEEPWPVVTSGYESCSFHLKFKIISELFFIL